MLTHVTRAVACEHPSLVLALIAAHFFLLRSSAPSRAVSLFLWSAADVSCARACAMYERPKDKEKRDGKRTKAGRVAGGGKGKIISLSSLSRESWELNYDRYRARRARGVVAGDSCRAFRILVSLILKRPE